MEHDLALHEKTIQILLIDITQPYDNDVMIDDLCGPCLPEEIVPGELMPCIYIIVVEIVVIGVGDIPFPCCSDSFPGISCFCL